MYIYTHVCPVLGVIKKHNYFGREFKRILNHIMHMCYWHRHIFGSQCCLDIYTFALCGKGTTLSLKEVMSKPRYF